MLRVPLRSPVTKLPPVRRFHPANLRAAWWAVQTARRTRQVLAARGLDAALAPPPPPPLPMEAERGVRGALRRQRGSCLVNAIVLQAWEAAHGLRRDLVVGVTGPEGFRAHAWLQGDPLPAADDAGLDLSVLDRSRDEGCPAAPEGANGSGQATGDGEGTPTRFDELLRRPAPHYSVRRSTRLR
jgi:Transglutaminase-like superfamily